MQCCFTCNRRYSKTMRKKFKCYNHMHGTHTNIWCIFNCSVSMFKRIHVMCLALSMLRSFATCLFLKMPTRKRWKQKCQDKYLEACAKSRGDLCFFTVREERNPKTFFFCDTDPIRNAESYGQHPVPPEHFPPIFQDRITLQAFTPIKHFFP